MINAKDAHCLTCKTIAQNKLKALNEVEERIKEAIDKEEFTVTIDDIFLNEERIDILKCNGYVLKSFYIPSKCTNGWIISW